MTKRTSVDVSWTIDLKDTLEERMLLINVQPRNKRHRGLVTSLE